MTLPKLATLALTLLSCAALAEAPARTGEKPPTKDPARLTGVLQSVDAKHGTFTLENLGADVDEALSRKLKEPRAAAPGPAEAGRGSDTRTVSVSGKTKIYIKFRTSPSVANNVELALKDLEPMTGYPVSVELAQAGERPVAATVVAWRGTPWRISDK